MKRLLCVLLTLVGTNARAGSFVKEFIEIRPGQRLWVEHRQSEHGRPTLFLANGLTYSTTQWQLFVDALTKLDPDLGLVLYDMEGMGQTLLDQAPLTTDIPFKRQVTDLKALYTQLAIEGPKVLGGLSYGGGLVLNYLSAYPDDFDQVIAMSPYLSPLVEQDNYLKRMVQVNRMLMPFDPRTDDEVYNFYLRQLIYTTYPSVEPIVLENPYKLEGVYRMVKGSKNWNVANVINRFPSNKLNLVVGARDEYIDVSLQQDFWNQLPAAAKSSFMIIKNAPHKLPEAVPDFLAAWTLKILNGDLSLRQGLQFSGDAELGLADSGNLTLPLTQKALDCATHLQTASKPR